MATDPDALVKEFCAAWERMDPDELAAYFTDDGVYHNIPLDPVTGREAIRATITGFTAGVDRVEFEVRHAAVDGDVVLNERVDRFFTPDRTIELPVMGTFEVRDGVITAWRDYFDMGQFMAQLTP